VFPHMCQLAFIEEEVYDCIVGMYSGKDIFSTCFSKHADFDEKID
jgi:hypothetical protein